jgi:hypothetical protein
MSRWLRVGYLAFIGLFVAGLVTNNDAFAAAGSFLICMFCLAIGANWHGLASHVWGQSLWPKQPALTLRLFRVVIGGGGAIIAAAVTTALLIAATR